MAGGNIKVVVRGKPTLKWTVDVLTLQQYGPSMGGRWTGERNAL